MSTFSIAFALKCFARDAHLVVSTINAITARPIPTGGQTLVMDRYLPPAAIDDFSLSGIADQLRKDWHDEVTGVLAFVRDPESYELASPLLYDQLADDSGVPDGQPQGIPWNGFPLRLTRWFAEHNPQEQELLANRAAEVILRLPVFGLYRRNAAGALIPLALPFRVQDEYCEWHVERDGEKIRRISFTCEPPEYWEFLAKRDFALVHRLYKELLHNPNIPANDLKWQHDVYNREGKLRYRAGDYNPHNAWNTEKGAIHLTHPANSLFAEVVLASDGTLGWPVEPDAHGNVDEQQLMCCAGRGGINRSSDPLILRGVFNFARNGLSVALANPIGLYMSPFSLSGLLDPDENLVIDNSNAPFVRQSADGTRILRAEIAPPAGAAYSLDACTIDGNPLRFGGQISRLITMRLFGVAKMIPGRQPRRVLSCPQFCCNHPDRAQFKGTFAFEDVANCNEVTAAQWKSEAYDIPEIQAAPMSVDESTRAPFQPLRPLGRKLVRADAEPHFELEKF